MLKQRPMSEHKDEPYGLVYFLSHGAVGPIKVGFTADRDPNARIRQLQIGSPEPLTLVGAVMAYASIERAIQTFLTPHHVRGEWFEREPALLLLDRFQLGTPFFHSSEFLNELLFLKIRRERAGGDDDDDREPLSVTVARHLVGDWVEQLRQVNTEKPLPFRAWLHTQTGRDDPTGDFACDATKDSRFPATGSLAAYLEYIVERAGGHAITRALVDAWIECDMALASLRVREQDVWDWGKDT